MLYYVQGNPEPYSEWPVLRKIARNKGEAAKAYRKRAGQELTKFTPDNWGMFRSRDGWAIRKVPKQDDKVERHFAITGLPREEDDIT